MSLLPIPLLPIAFGPTWFSTDSYTCSLTILSYQNGQAYYIGFCTQTLRDYFMSHKLKLFSINVRGLRNVSKRGAMFSYLKMQKATIYCLQETYSSPEDEKVWSFDQDILEKFEAAKEELKQLHEVRSKEAMFRSKMKWVEQGEKPTKYFYNLEKTNYEKKLIREVKLANEKIISNPS